MEGVCDQLFQIVGDLRLREGECLSLVVHQTALLVNGQHMEIVQVIQNGKVSQISGSNGTTVIQQEVPGRMQARHLHHLDGVSAQCHCLAANIVDVSLFQKVTGVLVIGAEHAAVKMPGGFHQIDQRFQILGGSTLPHHDKLTQPQFQQGVVQVGALMVGINTGRDIGI